MDRGCGTSVGPGKELVGTQAQKHSESWVGCFEWHRALYQEPRKYLEDYQETHGNCCRACPPLPPQECTISLHPNTILPLHLSFCTHVPFEILFSTHRKRTHFHQLQKHVNYVPTSALTQSRSYGYCQILSFLALLPFVSLVIVAYYRPSNSKLLIMKLFIKDRSLTLHGNAEGTRYDVCHVLIFHFQVIIDK